MTHKDVGLSWLEWRAMRTGKSVEELRTEMRERGAKADKKKTGFGAMKLKDPERLRQIGLNSELIKSRSSKIKDAP